MGSEEVLQRGQGRDYAWQPHGHGLEQHVRDVVSIRVCSNDAGHDENGRALGASSPLAGRQPPGKENALLEVSASYSRSKLAGEWSVSRDPALEIDLLVSQSAA